MDVVILEVAKILVYGAFRYMRENGLTDEESKALFEQERASFLLNDPDKLPDAIHDEDPTL